MPTTERDTFLFKIDSGSFRDPSGFVFQSNNRIYRAVAPSYFANYKLLHDSGLYNTLVSRKQLITHNEDVNILPVQFSDYKTIVHQKINFISYPYEWCFSQLKEAALLTLNIQIESLKHGMILKDASAFNIQFSEGKPIFIDTLSFEKYNEGTPWSAYRQFCQHFLAPLSLIAYKGESLSKLSQVFLDGIPLELTSSLLTKRSYLNSGIVSHIHIHSKIKPNALPAKGNKRKLSLNKKQLLNILEHLKNTVSNLNLKPQKSQWNKYEFENSYTENAKNEKSTTILNWLQSIKTKTIWDMGCNTGTYSLLASAYCDSIIAMDADYHSIEYLYNSIKNLDKKNILPIVIDLANPSPAIGWENIERKNLIQRGKPDLVMALALVHHLRITFGIPFEMIAKSFSEKGTWLIAEYVPKDDIQVKEMLMNREDIFSDFNLESFTLAFEKYFLIKDKIILHKSGRILFLMHSTPLHSTRDISPQPPAPRGAHVFQQRSRLH